MIDKRGNEVFGGVFLIGLAVLFLFGWWWPGILFVLGVALVARTTAEGKPWTEERGGLAVLAIGVLFMLTDVLDIFSFNWLPILLIGVGLYLLFGNRLRGNGGGSRGDLV